MCSPLPRLLAQSLPVLAVLSRPLAAQEWNSEAALRLVQRAIERRTTAHADSGVRRYRVRAEGVVLFLAELGPAPATPRLIKADQVAAEVYWIAPNRSKQRIVAWRERRYLPTDVRYHRDHLGIVTNDFGDHIRLGEGDEVRDVVHPLAAGGPARYQYALGDEVVVARRGAGGAAGAGEGVGVVRVREVLVRPRDRTLSAVVGTLYLDSRTAALVRFRFSFTAAAYRDPHLEDIAVELENALFDQRYWLPWYQAIEIRRRTAWLDFPVRTIIRGRWTLGDYDFDPTFPPDVFAGGPYGGLRAPGRPSAWTESGGADESLDDVAARVSGSAVAADLEELRRGAIDVIGAAAVLTRPPARLATGSVSDVAHVNRVQGLALGLGGSFGVTPALDLAPWLELGTADGRVLGGLVVAWHPRRIRWHAEVGRDLHDVSEWPVVSRALNSILAQEGGRDFGDYVLLERARVAAGVPASRGTTVLVAVGLERSRSVSVQAEPASGGYRENFRLGVGSMATGRLGIRSAGENGSAKLDGELGIEGGIGIGQEGQEEQRRQYMRATFAGGVEVPAGPGALVGRLRVGAGTRELPAYRAFPLGGRGTLVGERFREFGGRGLLLGRIEWQVPMPVPELRLGSYAGTGRTAILAPFFAIGWASGSVESVPWQGDGGVRPVLGVASELLFRVVRLELGWALRTGRVGLVLDAAPTWWPIL